MVELGLNIRDDAFLDYDEYESECGESKHDGDCQSLLACILSDIIREVKIGLKLQNSLSSCQKLLSSTDVENIFDRSHSSTKH